MCRFGEGVVGAAVLWTVAVTFGCGRPPDTPQAQAGGFLGLSDFSCRTIGEKAPESVLRDIVTVTTVMTTTYDDYLEHKRERELIAEEFRGHAIYFAIEQGRDVPFANGTSAWVFITERYKVEIPGNKGSRTLF